MTKILGVDLSLCSTGVVRLKDGKILSQKLIKSKPQGDFPIDELRRMLSIVDQIEVDGSDLVVIEGIAFAIRRTTSLVQLSALNYLVRKKCHETGKKFCIVAPNSLKKFITGKGSGHKEMMLLEVFKKYGISFDDNNLCDAWGLAQIGHCLLNKQEVPKYQQEVINLIKKQL